jgi:hypothetical protein
MKEKYTVTSANMAAMRATAVTINSAIRPHTPTLAGASPVKVLKKAYVIHPTIWGNTPKNSISRIPKAR